MTQLTTKQTIQQFVIMCNNVMFRGHGRSSLLSDSDHAYLMAAGLPDFQNPSAPTIKVIAHKKIQVVKLSKSVANQNC